MDADRGDGAGGRAGVLSARVCGGVADPAQHRGRGVPARRQLAAARPQPLRHLHPDAAAGAAAGHLAYILTGVRLAIGIIWIVRVPAEMLGVSEGLGYFSLDARDRLADSDLMAAILVIGFLGYLLDHAARSLHRRWLHT